MSDDAHNLKFTILCGNQQKAINQPSFQSDLETFVLEDSLDCGVLTTRREFGLENNAKGAIANYLALRVLHLSSLACQSILDLFANHL